VDPLPQQRQQVPDSEGLGWTSPFGKRHPGEDKPALAWEGAGVLRSVILVALGHPIASPGGSLVQVKTARPWETEPVLISSPEGLFCTVELWGRC
jgi:hypothetical protein